MSKFLPLLFIYLFSNNVLIACDTNVTSRAENNNEFAFELFENIYKSKENNILFSPYSVNEALAMCYAGAKSTTKEQMSKVLHTDEDDNAFHATFKEIKDIQNTKIDGYELKSANSLWPDSKYKILDSYNDILKKYYNVKVKKLDYGKDPDGTRKIINQWAEEKTNKTIKNLIPKGIIGRSTKLVLTNAIYLNAKWLDEFEKLNTRKEDFTTLDDKKLIVDMMRKEQRISYFENKNFKSVVLPYLANKASMVVILPHKDKFIKTIDNIKSNYHKAINADTMLVDLKLPKFTFATDVYRLRQPLSDLGMSSAFDPNADFSAISGTKDLNIDEVLHKAFIKVDETKSEAAAATAVVMPVGMAAAVMMEQPMPKKMYVNRPFIFFIKDNATSQILFIGVVKSIEGEKELLDEI